MEQRTLGSHVPRAKFSAFKMARASMATSGHTRLLKYSKNNGVLFHVMHNEMAFSDVISSAIGSRVCFDLAIWNRFPTKRRNFITFTDLYTTKHARNFVVFYARLAIQLKPEKARDVAKRMRANVLEVTRLFYFALSTEARDAVIAGN